MKNMSYVLLHLTDGPIKQIQKPICLMFTFSENFVITLLGILPVIVLPAHKDIKKTYI